MGYLLWAPMRRSKKILVDNPARLYALASRMRDETTGRALALRRPEALQKFVVSEAARWGKVINGNQIRSD